jgi:hypothetical protein
MNDIASIKKMRPFEPFGSAGAATVCFVALRGLAAPETVDDFAVFLVEGKKRFYQDSQPRSISGKCGCVPIGRAASGVSSPRMAKD